MQKTAGPSFTYVTVEPDCPPRRFCPRLKHLVAPNSTPLHVPFFLLSPLEPAMTLLSKVVPLVIFFVVLSVAAFIGYVVYTIATDVAEKTSKKMEKKNISFGKDGMKIGIQEVRNENYVDRTQRYEGADRSLETSTELMPFLSLLVKAWNYSSWPAYKSRFWNKENEPPQKAQARTP